MTILRALGLLVALMITSPAAADPIVDRCSAESERAQRARRAGKLLDARREFRACSQEECLGPIASFCLGRLAEVDAALPSVVVRAQDARGQDVADLEVWIDGVDAGRIDGRGIEVDPGPHSLVLKQGGLARSSTVSLVVSEGEKLRPITVQLSLPFEPSKPPPSAEPARSSLGYVFVATGLASLAATAALWGTALHDRSVELQPGGCAPMCSDDVRSSIKTRIIAGDVLAAAGVVSLGLAAYHLFFKPTPHAHTMR